MALTPTPTPTHTQAHFEDCICQDLHAHTTKAMRSGRLDVFSFHFGPFIRFTFEVTPYMTIANTAMYDLLKLVWWEITPAERY